MTFPPRPPSWGEIEQFCKCDGWIERRTTDHIFFQKVLDTGEVLETHRSLDARGSMSRRVFSLMLRTQLKVDRETFWNVVQTCEPADRPTPEQEPAPPQHELYVVRGLLDRGWTEDQIRDLSPEDAIAALHEEWSKPL